MVSLIAIEVTGEGIPVAIIANIESVDGSSIATGHATGRTQLVAVFAGAGSAA